MSHTNTTNFTASPNKDRAAQLNEMKYWAISFTVNKRVPRDLLPILTRDEAKQMEILMGNMTLERSKE
jgi:hypothetical protein